MKIPQLAGVIVTSMVIILVVVSVLIPIINNNDNVTYIESDNENYEYLMSKGDGTYGARVTLTTLGDSSATYTIGASGASTGTTKTLTEGETLVWVCDNAIAVCMNTGVKVLNSNVSATMRLLDAEGDFFDFSGAGVLSVTQDPGTESESIRTSPYTWVLYPDTAGDYAMYEGEFNLTKTGSMYGIYLGNASAVVGYGTASSMSQLVGHSGITSSYAITYTASDTYNTITGVSITYVGNSTTTLAALGCIAPLDYVSGTEGNGDIVKMLLDIVPVLIIVGVVMSVVGIYLKGRDY